MKEKIFILGGYGGTGKLVGEYILKYTHASVIVGGLDKNKADELVKYLNEKYSSSRAVGVYANAEDKNSLLQAMNDTRLVIDATNVPKYVQNVAEAAIEKGVDYLDYHFEQNVPAELEKLQEKIVNNKLCFITQAGFHPGLPAPLMRYAAKFFDQYEKAEVAMAMYSRIEKPESAYEIVDAIQNPSGKFYKDGRWYTTKINDIRIFDLNHFGKIGCFAVEMGEIEMMPEILGLKETGVYVAGFNWFVDWVVAPFGYLLGKIQKGFGRSLIAKLFIFGINNIKPRATGIVFALEAEGIKDGKKRKVRIVLEHDNPYHFTAIPVVACLKQYLVGTIKKPGVHFMGRLVDPEVLFADLKLMGVTITEKIYED